MMFKYYRCVKLIVASLAVVFIVITFRRFSSRHVLELSKKSDVRRVNDISFTMENGHSWFHSTAEFEESFAVLQNLPLHECSSSSSKLVVVVKSAPANFERRSELRQSWLLDATKLDIEHFFVLGDPRNSTILDMLAVELEQNQDLIVGKFVDHYYNLTLKGLFTFNWMTSHCGLRWLFYTDDDGLVNIANVQGLVESAIKNDVHKYDSTIYGYTWFDPIANRDPSNHAYIPKSIYPSTYLPDFVSGSGYLMSPITISKLLSAAIDPVTIPKLRLDDVYFTGFARQFANLSLNNAISLFMGRQGQDARALAEAFKTATIVCDIEGRVLKTYQLSKIN